MSYFMSIPAMNLQNMGFKAVSGNQLVFDSKEQTEDGHKIFVSIPVQASRHVVSFNEIFVNIGIMRNGGNPRSIKFSALPGGKLKLTPTYCYNNLLSSDQDQVNRIIQKIQKNLNKWNGSEADEDSAELALAASADQ